MAEQNLERMEENLQSRAEGEVHRIGVKAWEKETIARIFIESSSGNFSSKLVQRMERAVRIANIVKSTAINVVDEKVVKRGAVDLRSW